MSGPDAEPLYGDRLGAGAVVGDAIVEALVSEGGFARVYRATTFAGAPVALKVLHRELALSSKLVRRFQLEAESASLLSHPHIVRVLGTGALHDGRPYLVMEWLAGRDLDAAIAARGALPTAEALAVLEQLAGALATAHAHGIVHRDLKPANVMLLAEGPAPVAKVVDFGIAKLLDRRELGSGMTTFSMVGTPAYMAPEQIRGQPVDARTDVYALGLIAHLLLTGAPAFAAADVVACEELHLYAPPPRASLRAPLPAAVDAVVARCLAKRREDRFAGAVEAVAALAAALRGEGPRLVPGRAVHVRVPGLDDLDEAGLDAAEVRLTAARAALAGAGFTVLLELGDGLLAAAAGRPAVPALDGLDVRVVDGDVELDLAGQVRGGPACEQA